jgi:hypothetical protein
MYFEPSNWPQDGYAWTVQGAWEKFLLTRYQQLQALRERVVGVEHQIAAAEASLRAYEHTSQDPPLADATGA